MSVRAPRSNQNNLRCGFTQVTLAWRSCRRASFQQGFFHGHALHSGGVEAWLPARALLRRRQTDLNDLKLQQRVRHVPRFVRVLKRKSTCRFRWLASAGKDAADNTSERQSSEPSAGAASFAQPAASLDGIDRSVSQQARGFFSSIAVVMHQLRQMALRLWTALCVLVTLRGPILRRYFAEYAWFMLVLGVRLLVLMMTALLSPIIYVWVRLFPRYKAGVLWTEPHWPRRVCFLGGAASPFLQEMARVICMEAMRERSEQSNESKPQHSNICISWVDCHLAALEEARAVCTEVAPGLHFRLLHLTDLDMQSSGTRHAVLALREELGTFDLVVIAPALSSMTGASAMTSFSTLGKLDEQPRLERGSRLDTICTATELCYRRVVLAGSIATDLIDTNGQIIYITGTTKRFGTASESDVWIEHAWNAARMHARDARRFDRAVSGRVAVITAPAAYVLDRHGALADTYTRSMMDTSPKSEPVSTAIADAPPNAALDAPLRAVVAKLARYGISRVLLGEAEVVVPFRSAVLLLWQEALPCLVFETFSAFHRGASEAPPSNA